MSYPARIAVVNGKEIRLVVKTGSRWRKGVEVRCATCGYSFYIPECMIKEDYAGNNSQVHYCSPSCHAKSRKKTFVTNTCVTCSTPFPVTPPSKADRYKTCSPKCSSEYRRQLTTARHQRAREAQRTASAA